MRDAVLWNLRRGDSREAATAASAHSKRYEFPERLFTLLELAVVHRERSFFLAGREECRAGTALASEKTCAGSVQAKNAAHSVAVDAE